MSLNIKETFTFGNVWGGMGISLDKELYSDLEVAICG
jgi:hypothetical protein